MSSPDFIEEGPEEEKPLFSAKEIADIKAKARAEIIDDKKASLKKQMIADEKRRLRLEEGLTVGNSFMDEIVSITIDLAPYAPSIIINGRSYWHSKTYPVARHIAMSLQETMFNTWKHQGTIKGESLNEFYAQKHVQDVWAIGKGGKSLGTFSAGFRG